MVGVDSVYWATLYYKEWNGHIVPVVEKMVVRSFVSADGNGLCYVALNGNDTYKVIGRACAGQYGIDELRSIKKLLTLEERIVGWVSIDRLREIESNNYGLVDERKQHSKYLKRFMG